MSTVLFGGDDSGSILPFGTPNPLANAASQFAGVLSTKPTARFMSGARTTLKINGKLVGFAFNVSWNIMTSQDEIITIDDWTPYEYAPKRVVVEGTLGCLHIPGSGPSAKLWQSNVLSFLGHQYIVIEVRDSATDALLFYTGKAVITSRTENLQAEQLATTTLNFKAIGWQDEMQPAYPDGMVPTTDNDNNAANTNNLAGGADGSSLSAMQQAAANATGGFSLSNV